MKIILLALFICSTIFGQAPPTFPSTKTWIGGASFPPGSGAAAIPGSGPIMPFISTAASSVDGLSVTTLPINTGGATGIIIGASQGEHGGGLPFFNVSDSYHNTWVPAGYSVFGGQNQTAIYVCQPCITGPGHTFTSNPGLNGFPAIAVLGVINNSVSVFYDTPNTNNSAGSGTGINTGSVLCSRANCLYATVVTPNSGGATAAITSGFLIAAGTPQVNGSAYGNFLAYFIQTTAASVNPFWSFSATAPNIAVAIAAFRPAP